MYELRSIASNQLFSHGYECNRRVLKSSYSAKSKAHHTQDRQTDYKIVFHVAVEANAHVYVEYDLIENMLSLD